jgi:hypothetical protein
MGVRIYNLAVEPHTSRMILPGAQAACFGYEPGQLAVVLANGDLALATIDGQLKATVVTLEEVLGACLGRDQLRKQRAQRIRRVDIDW